MRVEKYKWIRYSAIGSALLLNVLVVGLCLWIVFTRQWNEPLDPSISAGDRLLVLPTLTAHFAELLSIFLLSLMMSILAFAAIAGISDLRGVQLLRLPGLAASIAVAAAYVTYGIDPAEFLDPGIVTALRGEEVINPARVYSSAALLQTGLLLAITAVVSIMREKMFQKAF